MPQAAVLAAYVVVQPGARGGTTNYSADEYYGTAAAAIVGPQAAV